MLGFISFGLTAAEIYKALCNSVASIPRKGRLNQWSTTRKKR